MRRWFERGGWIIALAVVLFLAFCIFARAYLPPDSGVNVPLFDWDLMVFTVYADEAATPSDMPGEDMQFDDLIAPEDDSGGLDDYFYPPDILPEDNDYLQEEPSVIASPSSDNDNAVTADIIQDNEDEEIKEPEQEQNESVGAGGVISDGGPFSPILPDEYNPSFEPSEYESPQLSPYEIQSFAQDETLQDGNETLFEIRDLLNVLVTTMLVCLAGYSIYALLKPLWWFIFY